MTTLTRITGNIVLPAKETIGKNYLHQVTSISYYDIVKVIGEQYPELDYHKAKEEHLDANSDLYTEYDALVESEDSDDADIEKAQWDIDDSFYDFYNARLATKGIKLEELPY